MKGQIFARGRRGIQRRDSSGRYGESVSRDEGLTVLDRSSAPRAPDTIDHRAELEDEGIPVPSSAGHLVTEAQGALRADTSNEVAPPAPTGPVIS